MQEVFENIIKALEEKRDEAEKNMELSDVLSEVNSYGGMFDALDKAIEIINQTAAEKYNDGWIQCSEHPPKECVPVNVTWINRNPESYYAKIKDVPFSATAVYYNSKWYWYSSTCVDYLSEYGENDFDLVDKDIDIIAWQPLPKPYHPKKDRANCKNRHENGNCLAIGGFCTSVDDKYCKYQPKGE